jgi:hypothetical protein
MTAGMVSCKSNNAVNIRELLLTAVQHITMQEIFYSLIILTLRDVCVLFTTYTK